MNNSNIKKFIKENLSLFWYIKEDAKEDISIDLLIETILNYGNEISVKKLFDLVGIKKVAEIFYRQISGNRVNYPPRTVHFIIYTLRRMHKGPYRFKGDFKKSKGDFQDLL